MSFEVAQFFRAEGSTGCSQWRKPLELVNSLRSALKGRHEPTPVAPSGLSKSNDPKPVAHATGYNLLSLSGLESRNFKTRERAQILDLLGRASCLQEKIRLRSDRSTVETDMP